MKLFKAQKLFDFEQPDWSKSPELYIIHQLLEQRIDIIKLAAPCFPNLDQNNIIGRSGMTLEQVVRCAIYMKIKKIPYRDLALDLVDSKMCIVFTNMEYGQRFSHQTLQENISKITPAVLEKINVEICKLAMELGIENGKKMRTDATAVESNIHYPTNCSLLWDCIRVACRILKNVTKIIKTINVSTYSKKTAKKLNYQIVNTKGQEKRIPLFKKMLRIQIKYMAQVKQAIVQLQAISFDDEKMEQPRQKFLSELESLLPKMEQVYDVAYRKEILNEQVPVAEKILSIFEDHTDCISKGGREVVFGHKVNMTAGKSNLIFDVTIEQGNPSDIDLFGKTLDNIKQNYDLVPRDFSADGGYASAINLNDAKERGIENIVFTKNKGKAQNIVSSRKMETMLKKWRSGMEAIISNVKRGLAAYRSSWKGFEAFQSFVLWSIIAYNLKILAVSLLINL